MMPRVGVTYRFVVASIFVTGVWKLCRKLCRKVRDMKSLAAARARYESVAIGPGQSSLVARFAPRVSRFPSDNASTLDRHCHYLVRTGLRPGQSLLVVRI